jgi:hypothetical protein
VLSIHVSIDGQSVDDIRNLIIRILYYVYEMIKIEIDAYALYRAQSKN